MNSQAHNTPVYGLGYLLDDHYLLHNPGLQHPESPQRLRAIRQMLETSGANDYFQRIAPREATIDELELIHNPAHVQRIEQASRTAPSHLDLDTSVSEHSYQTALLAAGGVLQCVDSICSGELRRVFAFIRPPGHHAGRERASGFCLFNNVALAAAYGRAEHKLERVAIVDMDVHHGNGTQSCFYSNPNVLYISSHQYPFYPGSGSFGEVGRGDGRGYTVNLPLPEGSGDSIFALIYAKIVSAVLDQYEPQLILVSAGFDGHFRDPLGGLTLTHAGYASAAGSLMLAADRVCGGKICFILEGGYHLQALKECSRAILTEMENQHPGELPAKENAVFKEVSRQAARSTAGIWKW
jgi:acetoin utilization deacetylase AcuC-like enzyme